MKDCYYALCVSFFVLVVVAGISGPKDAHAQSNCTAPFLGEAGPEVCVTITPSPGGASVTLRGPAAFGDPPVSVSGPFGEYELDLDVEYASNGIGMALTITGMVTRTSAGTQGITIDVEAGWGAGLPEGGGTISLIGNATGTAQIQTGGSAGFPAGLVPAQDISYTGFPVTCLENVFGPRPPGNVGEFECHKRELPVNAGAVAVRSITNFHLTDVGEMVEIGEGFIRQGLGNFPSTPGDDGLPGGSTGQVSLDCNPTACDVHVEVHILDSSPALYYDFGLAPNLVPDSVECFGADGTPGSAEIFGTAGVNDMGCFVPGGFAPPVGTWDTFGGTFRDVPCTDPHGQINLNSNPGGPQAIIQFECTPEGTPGSISGVKYNDLNGDGMLTEDPLGVFEPPIAGWDIFLDGSNAATTRSDGTYTISNVSPGSHDVSEADGSPEYLTNFDVIQVGVAAGKDSPNVNFGNRRTPPAFTKEFLPESVVPGGTTTLKFTISNPHSDHDVSNIAFTDTLGSVLPGLTASEFSPDPPCGSGSLLLGLGTPLVEFMAGNLLPDDSCTFSVTVDVPAETPPDIYTNTTSEITGDIGGDSTFGDEATGNLVVAAASASPTGLTKEFTDDPVSPGGTVTLEFTITNPNSSENATDISFTDNLGAALAGLEASGLPPLPNPPCGPGSQLAGTALLNFEGGSLDPGASCTFAVTLNVPPGSTPGSYVNLTSAITADVNGVPTEGSIASDSLVVDTPAVQPVSLTKEFTDDPVAPGGTVTLEFTLNNFDNVTGDATDITFSDSLDAVFSGLTATGLPPPNPCGIGSKLTGTTLLNFEGGSLDPGDSCTFTVTLNVPPESTPGSHANTTSEITATVDGQGTIGPPAHDNLVVAPPEVLLDWGDAPEVPPEDFEYPTTFSRDGARHEIDEAFYLGTEIDPEVDGQPNSAADGDDETGPSDDDEDGVGVGLGDFFGWIATARIPHRYFVGTTAIVCGISSQLGKLDAWIDWNADGDWDDIGEYFIVNEDVDFDQTGVGSCFHIPVPGGVVPAEGITTYARYRLTMLGIGTYAGYAPNGEVEDYLSKIFHLTTVNTTNDLGDTNPGDGMCQTSKGDCSLRAFLEEANANPGGAGAANFIVPGKRGVVTIQPQSPLPVISVPVVILGADDLEIDGSQAGAGANGFVLQSNDSQIESVLIHSFDGAGIQIDGDNNVLSSVRIRNNNGPGVSVVSGTGNVISTSEIFDNGGLGIDLGADGVTQDDVGDVDVGPNGLQNAPTLGAVTAENGHIEGILMSTPDTQFTIDFFASATCDISGFGEGMTFVGSATVTTDNLGSVGFNEFVTVNPISVGDAVTATATGPEGTSEFSGCFIAVTTDIERDEDAEIPQDYELFQNYPNPFNPVTNIRFAISNREWVKLEVYDILGKRVATLVDAWVESGEFSVDFDAAELPSGIYIYRMTAGSFSMSKQLTLLK